MRNYLGALPSCQQTTVLKLNGNGGDRGTRSVWSLRDIVGKINIKIGEIIYLKIIKGVRVVDERCERCNREILPEGSFVHAGEMLCEDCYMDVLNPPKPCDPWAVYTAQKSMERGVQLTPSQKKIVELLRQEGDLAMEEIRRRLTMKPEELKREFAALRHMGLVRAKKMGEKICLSII